VSLEPALADRSTSGLDGDLTYICVPVQQARKCRGVLEVELAFRSDRNYDRTAKFYGVVATMLAQALEMQRLLESDRQRLVAENVRLRDELRERYDFSHILGTSGAMRQVYEQVVKVARTNTTVLIRGESGTGKELIAQAIHHNSLRARKPFIKVSCAALPDTLIESELFGYEKGAFTGAEQRKKGRFELADGGTLLLDEVGDINVPTQVKLLRVLQEREFERLGGAESVKVDVRLIAATNKDMESAVAQGALRQDLLYRLNVFTIFVPPLRERKSDILLLADHFAEKLAAEQGKQVKRISTSAIDALVAYHWPGNVRELQNVMERAVLVSDGHVIHMHHLPPTLQTAEGSGTATTQSLGEAVGAFERDMIEDALKMARGNRARAARLLQATRRVVNYKIRQYQIDWRRYAEDDAERPERL
jgi:Nif-specific regulatory protein